MWLILLLVAAGIGGYFFARSRFSKPVEDTASKVGTVTVETTKEYSGKASSWWQRQFGRGDGSDPFRVWAAGAGAAQLPEDFKSWLAGLSEEEAKAFTKSLYDYGKSLGYDFDKLVDGSLDSQPARMQVYVEAVVVYSQAYRKAKQAQKESETAKPEASATNNSSDGKTAAEKSTSRRKSEAPESSESAATA
jgi:hypothetical protein